MKQFQLIEFKEHKDILFSSASFFSEELSTFKGGEHLAFYELYEFMPITSPFKPLIKAVYKNNKLYKLNIDKENKKVSFDRKKELQKNEICCILNYNIEDLLFQLDIYLTYNYIVIDVNELREKISISLNMKENIEIEDLYNDKEEKFTLILNGYEEGLIFILRKAFEH